MSWDKCFEGLMPDTVVVATRTTGTLSFDGTPTWSTSGSTYKARVVARPRMEHLNDGSVVQITHVAWIASTGTIHPHDRITLSDGRQPRIMSISAPTDEDGVHHHVVEFG